MQDQYDRLAADYEWLLSDPAAKAESHAEGLRPTLDALGPEPAVLDCACGTGLLALALAARGCRVAGSDASAAMIARAKAHAGERGAEVRFEVCPWVRLPKTFDSEFDLAICCGNAIGHCRDEEEMLESLGGIRSVLRDGGRLVVDSRNWEKLLSERERFHTFGLRVREGVRCIPLCVHTFAEDWGRPHRIDVVFLFEQDGKMIIRTYPITYYPFHVEQLVQRLKQAGFADVELDYGEDDKSYSITARRA